MECFLDWEFLMAASSNQKHAHFIPFKPTPKTLVIQIYKKDSTEQIHTSDKNMANTLFLLSTVLSLHFHTQSYNSSILKLYFSSPTIQLTLNPITRKSTCIVTFLTTCQDARIQQALPFSTWETALSTKASSS